MSSPLHLEWRARGSLPTSTQPVERHARSVVTPASGLHSARRHARNGSDAGELSVQLIETEVTESEETGEERGGRKALNPTRRPAGGARRGGAGEPHPLTDLVADRLAG